MEYHQYEIWWAQLGEDNEGSEKNGLRPVIVLSNDICNKTSPLITIAPITSNIRRMYRTNVRLHRGEGGLTKEAKVCCEQIRTIDKERVTFFMGTLCNKRVVEIKEAIKFTLGI